MYMKGGPAIVQAPVAMGNAVIVDDSVSVSLKC